MNRRGRRRLTGTVAILAAGIALATASADESQGGRSLARLKAGNARFVTDPSAALPVTAAQRLGIAAAGAVPVATVLSCADARVPPEIIFNAGLGELFVVRAAGHVADRAALASLEYASERLQAPLLVVMGHEMCDVIDAAMQAPKGSGPNLEYLFTAIRPSIDRVAKMPADTRVRATTLQHVEETINQLLAASPVLARRAGTQQLMIAGAYYELSSGRVHFSEPVHVPPSMAPARGAATAPAR